MIERDKDGRVKNSIRANANMNVFETIRYRVIPQLPKGYAETIKLMKDGLLGLFGFLTLPIIGVYVSLNQRRRDRKYMDENYPNWRKGDYENKN